MTRKYSSTSTATTLSVGVSNTATTITVASGTGSSIMGGVTLAAGNVDQFTIAIDPDTVNEEIVFVTQVSSDTLTIVRGRAGTSAISHSAGAAVKHVLTSDDLAYFNTAVQPTIVDAKGDLLAGTASDTLARVAVGTNNQVLTADSTQTAGIKWADTVAPSDYSAKGVILVGTGTGTYTAQTIGTNGQYLQADSTQTDGVKWATVDALPSQTSNGGKYLTTDGTTASWATITTDSTPDIFMLMGA